LYYNTLGKGDAALSRFIPLADGFGHGNGVCSTTSKPSKRIAVQSKPQVCLLYTREQRDALLRPLAGLGELPLHLHRTMHEHMDVQLPFRGAHPLPLKTP
jgi:hypothetical protein